MRDHLPYGISISRITSFSNWKHDLSQHWYYNLVYTWRRHQMETFSALLAICAGNSPVPGEVPAQRPVTRSFDVFFDLRPNKRLSKQWWGWWFKTPSCPLWRHCNKLLVISHQRCLDPHTPPVIVMPWLWKISLCMPTLLYECVTDIIRRLYHVRYSDT